MGFSGALWVRTNGKITVIRNGWGFTVAAAGDLSHPTAWDFRDPNEPGDANSPGGKAILQDDDVYELGLNGAIFWWNFSDPAHPVFKGTLGDCHAEYEFTDFALKNSSFLVTAGEGGLYVLDPSNGGRITVQNTFGPPSGTALLSAITLVGDDAIVIDGIDHMLGVYDVSDLAFPKDKGSSPCPATMYVAGLFYQAPYLIMVLSLADNPDGAFAGNTQIGVFEFPDPSDPATFNPVPVNAQTPVLLGGWVYDVAFQNNRLYCTVGSTVQGVDLSTPSAPSLSLCFDDSSYHPNNMCQSVAVSGDMGLVADLAGVSAFDLNGNRVDHVITGSMLMGGYFYYKPFSLNSDGSFGLVNLAGEGVELTDFSSSVPRRMSFWENTVGGSKGYHYSLLLPDGGYASCGH